MGSVRALAAALAVFLVAACGDDPAAPPPTSTGAGASTVDTTPGPVTSAVPTVPTDTTRPAPTRTVPSTTTVPAGEPAPDFALELGNGGTFLLSEEARPVFMVFWAEW